MQGSWDTERYQRHRWARKDAVARIRKDINILVGSCHEHGRDIPLAHDTAAEIRCAIERLQGLLEREMEIANAAE